MNGHTKQRIVFFSLFYLCSFLLNFLWESGQGVLYTAHQELAAREYVPMMVQMALLDALSLTGIYLFTSFCARSLLWPPHIRNIAVFSFAGLVSAWTVEYISVNLLRAWSYTPDMPLLFMVGLGPLLQLAVTGLAAIFMARRQAGFSNE
ncbi:MAG: hypothetical protein HGB00_00135 [Chlorobiaceae bacterium]|nr:hypothetical protein [Chlorobiaceae bacterium]